MTLTDPVLPELRQPTPTYIDTIEAAIRVIEIDPTLENPTTSYAFGYLHGGIAALMFCVNDCFQLSAHATDHEQAYMSRLRPMSLVAALSKHSDLHELRLVGWLTGWRDWTRRTRKRAECPRCARALIEGLDGGFRCTVDGAVLCASDTRDCWREYCTSGEHADCDASLRVHAAAAAAAT